MGKNLIQQRRGRGARYRALSFRYKGQPKYGQYIASQKTGTVIDLIHCPGHSAPLAKIMFGKDYVLMQAPEGIKVGDNVSAGPGSEISNGNVLALQDIPEGTAIFNIEMQPGDGGKAVRAAGSFATVLQKLGSMVLVQLPSKKTRQFQAMCRATIGRIAGGGKLEKPMVKAGVKYHAKKARRKLYPIVSGVAMNAVDHPFGKSRSSKKGKSTIAPRNAPPGRKVGKLRPRRTGRKR
ncbi:50S ribosomal protein L2 [Candidatus Woesearchaeota archaeon]|nr:50S ribosomal protein L2 [Candidatus Woesearchaeota archaeon]